MTIRLLKRGDSTLAARFTRFSDEDLRELKAIPGRRWLPEEGVWCLPYTLSAIEQLVIAFADRLEVEPSLAEACYLLADPKESLAMLKRSVVGEADGG